MSIENSINELTAAIKELTATLSTKSSGDVPQVSPQEQSKSTSPQGTVTASEMVIPTLGDSKVTGTEPQVSSSTDSKPKGKTKDAPEMAPEAPSAPTKAREKVVTYEDAATVLIGKDKTARKALIKEFKEDAEKLVDLADMGDDIWTRVIEAAKDIPEKS